MRSAEKNKMTTDNENKISIKKEEILSGFQVNWIILRDIDSGKILWKGNEDYSSPEHVFEIKLPKNILHLRGVSRELHFTSVDSWETLKITQSMTYKGVIMDEVRFEYGPVQANTNNSWLSVIFGATETQLMPPDILSGNLVITTKFYNGESLITTSRCRVFYVD